MIKIIRKAIPLAAIVTTIMFTGSRTEVPHFSVDGTRFVSVHGDNVYTSKLGDVSKGVSIDTGGASSGHIEYNPVELAVGESFEFEALDESNAVLVSMELVQTGATQTDVWMKIGMIDYVQGPMVTLVARDRDGEGVEIEVPLTEKIFLGSVSAPTSAWGETWTWYCYAGECEWIQDPDGTSIEFASLPGQSIPFHFLGMKMRLKDGVEIRVGRVEMHSGRGSIAK